MSKEALYKERYDLIEKAINLEPVKRIPVVYIGVAFAPRYMGVKMSDYVGDPEVASKTTFDTLDRLGKIGGGLDGVNTAGGGSPLALAGLWLSKVKLPGRELPEDSLWQVHETEVMTEEDYDTILEKGWGFFVQDYLPRVVDPDEFGQAMQWRIVNTPRILKTHRDKALVVICDSPIGGQIPFEAMCGARSMTRFMRDLYSIPDKVEAAMEIALAETLARIEAYDGPMGGINGTWVGGWRSASAMLSPKLWNRFVWPYIVKVSNALIDKGATPVFHWDHDWTRDLERLKEFPARSCILNPDGMTDLRKFKDIVGDRMAVMGDVPAAMFAAGTPDDIYNYVRDLVRDIGPTGLIVCPVCDAPIDTKPENMEAFVAAAHEVGTL